MVGSSVTQHEERPVPTVPPLTITDEERAELERRVRAHTTPQRAAKRARIVLLAAAGAPHRTTPPRAARQRAAARRRRAHPPDRPDGGPERAHHGAVAPSL